MDRLNPPATHHARVVLRELARVMRRLTDGLSGEAVLDYGAGPAPYRPLFAGYDRYVTADLPGESADLTIEDGTVPAPDGSFDLVLSTQVLEHVPNPDAYLAEARRLLTPDGSLILSTHGVYWYHPVPEDLWRWTGPGLRRQIERCGFVVTDLVPVVTAPAAAVNMFCQYAAELFVPRRARPTWHLVSQLLVDVVDRLATARRATSHDAALFVMVARPSPSHALSPAE
jgi:SAM-dependent methyltransferase